MFPRPDKALDQVGCQQPPQGYKPPRSRFKEQIIDRSSQMFDLDSCEDPVGIVKPDLQRRSAQKSPSGRLEPQRRYCPRTMPTATEHAAMTSRTLHPALHGAQVSVDPPRYGRNRRRVEANLPAVQYDISDYVAAAAALNVNQERYGCSETTISSPAHREEYGCCACIVM
ncbi:hypothetical protein A0H81_13213 [Grifola frondosa]|uniref:Uncharacterized protein n=1 Tax=Grifola frondosa TaxID=5627 RepID=A0A1C7LSJ3_GRIFR|nr:hypothetical protein A0H81_13213 [Grifola frondosa]